MMNIEDFKNMFRAHLSHEIWDFPRKQQTRFSTAGKSIPARIWQTPLK